MAALIPADMRRRLDLAICAAAMIAAAGAAAWWWTATAYAACHTWLGGLAQGLSSPVAQDCSLASLAHNAGALAFWLGLIGCPAAGYARWRAETTTTTEGR
jgi:hypothetical protein